MSERMLPPEESYSTFTSNPSRDEKTHGRSFISLALGGEIDAINAFLLRHSRSVASCSFLFLYLSRTFTPHVRYVFNIVTMTIFLIFLPRHSRCSCYLVSHLNAHHYSARTIHFHNDLTMTFLSSLLLLRHSRSAASYSFFLQSYPLIMPITRHGLYIFIIILF